MQLTPAQSRNGFDMARKRLLTDGSVLCCLDKQVRNQPQSVGVSRLTNLPDCHLCAECKIITVARNDKLWMVGVERNTFNQSLLFTLQVPTVKPAFPLGEKSFHSFFFLFCFVLFCFSCGMWDLSSMTRDQTRIPCSGSTES